MVWSVRNDHPTPMMDTIDTTTHGSADAASAGERRRPHQSRQGDDVAGCGHERGHDVVEIPPEADRTARHDEGDPEHDHGGDRAAHRTHGDEVDGRHRRRHVEHDRNTLREEGELNRDHKAEDQRCGRVLTDDGVETGRELKHAGVDRCAEATTERTEDVALHCEGSRNKQEQAR